MRKIALEVRARGACACYVYHLGLVSSVSRTAQYGDIVDGIGGGSGSVAIWRSAAPGLGLRVGIKKTGCSGFAYVVNYADEIHPGDAVFEARGVKVVVDSASLPLIDGTVVDFVKQGLNEAFKFQNPKAKGECGCGESFNV